MLGGAVGDALGAGIEFQTLDQIRGRHGPDGVTDYVPAYGRRGAITDDTQMTLFTAEGCIRAQRRGEDRGACDPLNVVRGAYLRWLHTQGDSGDSIPRLNDM
ncbi:MAG: ADP-ribosylglycohydrolase family protein, partial [Gemmatimonadota bacterium]